jgi:hypothetical protein
VFVTFSRGGYARYRLWGSLAIFGMTSSSIKEKHNTPHSTRKPAPHFPRHLRQMLALRDLHYSGVGVAIALSPMFSTDAGTVE